MSIESAKACIERIKTDEDFAKKVIECKDAEARTAVVKAAGFDFTAEELQAWRDELSDDELDSVAGGRLVCEEHPIMRGVGFLR